MSKKNEQTGSFDLNVTEIGALKHGLQKFGTAYSKIQKEYFPNFQRKDLQNFVERHPDYLAIGKQRKKELSEEKKEKPSRKQRAESEEEDEDYETDEEEEEEEKKKKWIVSYEPQNELIKDRPFNQKNDLVDAGMRPYMAIPADLLSSPVSYHVLYRCNKGQTVRTKVDSIRGFIELQVFSEPLFASEYRLTEASKLIPKPKRERHLSIIPIFFPNDASLGIFPSIRFNYIILFYIFNSSLFKF